MKSLPVLAFAALIFAGLAADAPAQCSGGSCGVPRSYATAPAPFYGSALTSPYAYAPRASYAPPFAYGYAAPRYYSRPRYYAAPVAAPRYYARPSYGGCYGGSCPR